MKNKAINTLQLNSVSISNLASISGGLVANGSSQQPVPVAPSTAGPTWDCGYSAGCHTKGCVK